MDDLKNYWLLFLMYQKVPYFLYIATRLFGIDVYNFCTKVATMNSLLPFCKNLILVYIPSYQVRNIAQN